ncbi:phosphorylase b kinase regulatory subunit beta [Anomaloglossus baeobatrachus]|uniref:phosphorylase b kinase regulatory subunit beta n=1 Tax=Anomaloglossus baeobatrachus TaxID=238106 RepID=UPI003F4F5E17
MAQVLADVSWKVLELRARSRRSGSVYEPLKSIDLPRPDNESLWDKLDRYYRIVKITVLGFQSPTTGLFPTETVGDCKKAKIHDSLYCAASIWALALAYRRIDDDKGRTHELEHSAIKCMRGILYCYMRQADKVEQFKQDPSPQKCLHSIFHLDTGDELLSYEKYGHLQINAVSLFLLYLVEMISSGLQIIYNTDEVSFIQNLVFCVERAYRVPDFGIWERGSKYNNGSTELHSSSVGLAKAALEAIDGFNLFGNQGCSWSVIFVDLDAHNRNRQTLCSLLPRESRSHNTDAALLTCISYPAFAVDDDALFHQAMDKIVRKLKGRYGLKRFLRDGFKTALEDEERRYYKPAEIKLFDGIECEFPVFFIYMIIDGESPQALHWRLWGAGFDRFGRSLLPLKGVLPDYLHSRGSRFNPILDMLASFKNGNVAGVKVHVDRLQTLISGAMVEQLDFLRISESEVIPEFHSFEELEVPKHSKVNRQSSIPIADRDKQPEINIAEWKQRPTYEVLQKLNDCTCLASQAILISVLMKREGPNFITKEGTVSDFMERIYRKAGSNKLWSVVRLAASLLGKIVDSLAPSITNALVQGKQVTLGVFGHEEAVISNPLSPGVIKDIIYSKCSGGDEREAVLQQELVIHIGWIISNTPQLFSGMLKIRVGWIIHAMRYELKIRSGEQPEEDIYQLSPSEIKQLLLCILQPQQSGRCWLNRRQIDGSLNRNPAGFYDRVWQILERTPSGIMVSGKFLPQQPTLSDMTMYEMNFSLLVEDMLQNISQPEYRQIIVELLMIVSVILERNPEFEFQEKVDLDRLVTEAFSDFQRDQNRLQGAEKQEDMSAFYNTPPLGKRGTCSYLTKAVMNLLLEAEVRPGTDDPCSVS